MAFLLNIHAFEAQKNVLYPLIASAKPRFPIVNYANTRTRAGLSLVEVMIALALLATVISALMGTLGNAASVNTTADLRERAVTASHRYIEQIQEANSLYSIYQTFAAKTFDVEQSFLQQHQLRLNFNVEAT